MRGGATTVTSCRRQVPGETLASEMMRLVLHADFGAIADAAQEHEAERSCDLGAVRPEIENVECGGFTATETAGP